MSLLCSFLFGVVFLFFFFFSSRRRHTRFDCDWSSDVCSSDLGGAAFAQAPTQAPPPEAKPAPEAKPTPGDGYTIHVTAAHLIDGKVRGPFHHYCKVVAPDPFIQCLLF